MFRRATIFSQKQTFGLFHFRKSIFLSVDYPPAERIFEEGGGGRPELIKLTPRCNDENVSTYALGVGLQKYLHSIMELKLSKPAGKLKLTKFTVVNRYPVDHSRVCGLGPPRISRRGRGRRLGRGGGS